MKEGGLDPQRHGLESEMSQDFANRCRAEHTGPTVSVVTVDFAIREAAKLGKLLESFGSHWATLNKISQSQYPP